MSRFSSIGVADLDVGAFGRLGLDIVGEGGRSQHAHTPDAVSARRRAEQDGQVAFATRPAQKRGGPSAKGRNTTR